MLDRVLRPGAIGPLALEHRVVMGSMHLGLETLADGGAALAAFYAERARGGAALIVTGGCAVNPAGAAGPSYGLIADGGHARRLRRAAAAVHEAGGRLALQLFHAGRYAEMGGPTAVPPVAPSALPARFSKAPPHALSAAEVEQTIDDFAHGAARARELGFDAVEVMASEGYLVNQFCSPLTNHRDDAWGGDAERRRRFALAVLERIRAAVGDDFAIIMRISGADLMDGSSPPEEVAALARALAGAGADALNVGVGWHESRVPTVQTLVPPGTWVRFTAAVKAAVGDVPVIASNRVNRLEHAERVLAAGACDFVSMARPFLADPDIVARARAGAGAHINVCIACNQACIDRSIVDERVSCMVNPRAGRELEGPPGAGTRDGRDAVSRSDGPAGRMAVVGAGPAGLQAALDLALLGHRVELLEAAGELGGQFRLARLIPGKADYGATISSFAARLDALGVEVRCGTRLTADDAPRLAAFDGVVLATGVVARSLELPGGDLPHVRAYGPAIERAGALGERVAIVGAGGIGVDVAHLLSAPPGAGEDVDVFLAAHGLAPAPPGARAAPPARAVTLLCRGPRIGTGMGLTTRWAVVDALRRAGVRLLTGVTYRRIVPGGLEITGADGRDELVEADTVVVAAGSEPNDPLSAALAGLGVPFRVVGGARRGGADAVAAFEEGRRAAHELAAALGPAAR